MSLLTTDLGQHLYLLSQPWVDHCHRFSLALELVMVDYIASWRKTKKANKKQINMLLHIFQQ